MKKKINVNENELMLPYNRHHKTLVFNIRFGYFTRYGTDERMIIDYPDGNRLPPPTDTWNAKEDTNGALFGLQNNL